MHKFIEDVTNGEEICGFYLCKTLSIQKKTDGKDYLRVEIADKTGSCQGICWEDPKKFDVSVKSIGGIVKVKGIMGDYKGVAQLRIYNIRNARDDDKNEFSIDNISTCAPIDADACIEEVSDLIDSIEDADYRLVAKTVFTAIKEKFMTIPAGKVVHHSFRNGLLMHTLNMMKLANFTSEIYDNIINRSLLLSATFLHDIAKIQEFELSDLGLVNDYSKQGQLLGHLYMGALEVEKVCEKLNINKEKSLLLQHMILSHHGEPDKGAVVSPKFAEAEALHIIDLMDSRLEIYAEECEHLEVGQFMPKKNWALDHRVYRNK